MLDRARFLKVLALLSSDTDGEALAACRTACRILADAGMSWDDVIGRLPTPRNFQIIVDGDDHLLPPCGPTWAASIRRLAASAVRPGLFPADVRRLDRLLLRADDMPDVETARWLIGISRM